MSGDHNIVKPEAETPTAQPAIKQKSSDAKPRTHSNKWKYAFIGAVAIIGIACSATGIGAVVGIPLLAMSGVAIVSLVSEPAKPQNKSSTGALLKHLNKKDPR